MGKIIALGFDEKSRESLYNLGYMIGRYVYILDAADDLRSDIKSDSFNPFKAEFGNSQGEAFAEKVKGMLNLTQSVALESLDSLDKKRFEDILENIVLDGLTFSSEKVLAKYMPEKEERTYTVK